MYSKNIIAHGCGWPAVGVGAECSMGLPWDNGAPPTTLRGILGAPATWGYPTHQPEPCSSLHHAPNSFATAFKLRVSPARCSSKGIIMSHHLVQWEFGMTKLHLPLFAKNGSSSPLCNPTIMPHTQFMANTKQRHCHRFTRVAQIQNRLTAYSVPGRNLVDVIFKMHFDGSYTW